jgi:nucleotide-binding universal stress UspA family protein
MRVLVLTSEPISAAKLASALPGDVDPKDVELMVVAPALQPSALRFWLSDADDAIARAQRTEHETVERLSREGVDVDSETGESDPEQAIQDALQTFPADQILIFTHPEEEQRYREDVDTAVLERRFGLPVKQATVG